MTSYQVFVQPGIGQFREFESPRVHTCKKEPLVKIRTYDLDITSYAAYYLELDHRGCRSSRCCRCYKRVDTKCLHNTTSPQWSSGYNLKRIFFSSFSPPFIILALLSPSLPVVTQTRGDIAGPPLPSPLRYVPSFSSRE